MSWKIVEAVKLTCLGSGCEISHVRDVHTARTQDETWLPHFANEGGVAILTGDSRILKRPNQLAAIKQCGLVSVVLSDQWSHQKRGWQAANVMFWWSRIELALKEATPGDCFLVPPAFEKGSLEKKVIAYDKASKATGA